MKKNIEYIIPYDKYLKLYSKLKKYCKKKNITVISELSFNNNVHMYFRKQAETGKYDYEGSYIYDGIDSAECYINERDLLEQPIWRLMMDIKGFINISFGLR